MAIKLARQFGGIIISADSRQIYRDMNIGTAKPTRAERKAVPHYLLDFVKPDQRYSAKDFQEAVNKLVDKHRDEPIYIVGGTNLYVDAVLKGFDFAGAPPDRVLRRKLEKLSLSQLKSRLKKLDPVSFDQIDTANKRRLVRAIEAATQAGSFVSKRKAQKPDWKILKLAIQVDRKKLDRQNEQRVSKMLRAGWAAEVSRLKSRYEKTDPGLLAHGYREMWEYIDGKLTREELERTINRQTHQFIRRQLSWLKKDPDIVWVKTAAQAKARVKKFLR